MAISMALMPNLNILMLAANPVGGRVASLGDARNLVGSETPALYLHGQSLQLDRELALIQEILKSGKYRDRVRMECRWAVSPDRLLAAFSEVEANAVHFMGHSSRDGIVLSDEENRPVLLPAELLVRTLKAVGDRVRLVLLNSCESFDVAQKLAEVCGCAIGMSAAIPDEAAWTFSRAFYRALTDGRTVKNALEQGRLALAYRNMREDDLPRLVATVDADNLGLAVPTTAQTPVGPQTNRHVKLTPEELEEVIEAAEACDILLRRPELLSGLPVRLRNSLPVVEVAVGQVRRDLHALNDIGRVRGVDQPVLALWLRSAETLVSFRSESEVFTRMRERILAG